MRIGEREVVIVDLFYYFAIAIGIIAIIAKLSVIIIYGFFL